MKEASVFQRILTVFLCMFMVLGLLGCSHEDPSVEEIPSDQGGDNEVIEDDTEDEYIETYPRTQIGFVYNDLYAGSLKPKGKIRFMIIPIRIDGGELMDEGFFDDLKAMMEEETDNGFFLNVKDYYRNASYGQFDFEYDVMPVYELGITLNQWINGEKKFKGIYEREAIVYTIEQYVSDPDIYDSDGDGYLDSIICVINEPQEVENTSRCVLLSDYDASSFPDDIRIRMFLDTQVNDFDVSFLDYRNNAIKHELAHYFGIDDYYDYRGLNSFASAFDLQAGDYGDWNPFSKIAVGWIDPYVITPDVEKVTITLRNSAEYPDAILIPCGEWNGTPFDEYLLLDVFTGRGNNEIPFPVFYQIDYENNASEVYGGVRLYHVDARLMAREHYTGEGLGWFNDFSGQERYSKYDVCHAYSNATATAQAMNDSPDRNPDYHLLSLIPASRENVQPGNTYYSSYLFHAGDEFTMEKYSRFFPNDLLSNKRESISYKFTVDSYDDEAKEAVITIEKEH